MSAAAAPTESHRRPSPPAHVCPRCAAPVHAAAPRCPDCGFSAADTAALFPGDPPPLLPVLDAAALFAGRDLETIATARDALGRGFPQFRWHVCTVCLEPGTSLPVFGFWLLNSCPLVVGETAEHRAWTVLLLLDSESGQAAVIPGHAAEPCWSDAGWEAALAEMAAPWQAGEPAAAIAAFFEAARRGLGRSWRQHGLRGKNVP